MPTLNLLYKREYAINDHVKVVIPTVGEVIDDEENYYNIVNILTAMPIDFMVPLTDAGFDFAELNEYELFLILSEGLKKQDTHLVLGDLDLNKFSLDVNPQNGMVRLYDAEDDIAIDRNIHARIAATLRKIHHLKRNHRKPANKEAKEYMIERARKKMARNKKRTQESQLESLIVAMVNTEQYKYGFEGTRELSICQFNECVQQVIKKVDYEHQMFGVYTGNIDAKKLSQDDFNWLIHK